MRHLYMAAMAGVMLVSCASAPKLTADQCSAQDWYALGQKDGSTGQSMTALNDEIVQCKQFGVTPDLDTYKRGRTEGLKTYCVPATILDATIQSVGDPFTCDPLTPAMKAAVDKGNETKAAVGRYQAYQAEYKKLTDAKAQINQQGAQLQQQYNASTDQAQRQQLAAQLNQLVTQLKEVDAAIAKADPVMATEKQTYETAVQSYESYKASLTR